MAQVIWTEAALNELDAIADYISLDKPIAAKQLVQRVLHKVELLTQFPMLGKIPPEIKDQPYRQLFIPPCHVFYRIEGKRTYIVSVLRSEKKLKLLR